MLLPAAILLALVAAAAGLFARRARLLYGLVRLGRPVDRTRDVPVRLEREVTVVLGQRKLLQRLLPGVMHASIIWGFLVYIPYSKHLHIITSSINVFFSNTKPKGYLTPLRIDVDAPDSDQIRLGAATVEDLTWKEALDLYACTECGRCQSACPAWNTGKPLSPKLLIMNLRDHLFDEGPKILEAGRTSNDIRKTSLVPEVVDEEVVWACTTCGACMQECPVDIEHIDHIVDLRRNLVMGESRFPPESAALLRNLETAGNPWGQPQSQRAAWAEGMDVRLLGPGEQAPDVIYWVGCAGSFDDRARGVSRAVASLLRDAGLSFAILGPQELCTGDPARRIE